MLPCMPVSSHSTNDSYDIRRDTRRWRLDFGSQVYVAGLAVSNRGRTSTAGTYDFEEIPSGKYRIRVQYGGGFFCAPDVECRMGGCSLKPIWRLRQKPLPIE